MHKAYSIHAKKISKRFDKNLLFKNISFSINTGESFFVTGPNGSGKSTLLQIIAGIRTCTSGEILYNIYNKNIPEEERFNHIGFVAPYLNVYDSLTALENIEFASRENNKDKIDSMLNDFDLYAHRNKATGLFSSGMKQRLKLIIAMINSPGILILDEPGTNLDYKGKDILYNEIEKLKKNTLIIIASNENEEIKLCQKGINIAEQNS